MSKYLMNKLIHLVNMDEEAKKEYKANPRAFVEKWEKTQKLKLTPEEREALATKDMASYTRWARIRSRYGASPKRYGYMKNGAKN